MLLATVVIHNGHIIVTDVKFFGGAVGIRFFVWHQSSHMEDDCEKDEVMMIIKTRHPTLNELLLPNISKFPVTTFEV
jgi:hypothetical protein